MTNEIKNTCFQDRLKLIITRSGDQKKDFAKNCGIAETQLYGYLNGASEPGTKVYQKMKRRYPWINIDWLISGEGCPEISNDNRDSNVIELQHIDIVKGFNDKARAKSINAALLELERTSPSAFEAIEAYIKGMVSGIQLMVAEPAPSYGERRTKDDPGQIPPEGDRRAGPDRRKVGG
jgi:hypothetical protein